MREACSVVWSVLVLLFQSRRHQLNIQLASGEGLERRTDVTRNLSTRSTSARPLRGEVLSARPGSWNSGAAASVTSSARASRLCIALILLHQRLAWLSRRATSPELILLNQFKEMGSQLGRATAPSVVWVPGLELRPKIESQQR
jgi:hypothetical protein